MLGTVLYFDSHCHSVQFGHTFRRGPRPTQHTMHQISQLGIPNWWPI